MQIVESRTASGVRMLTADAADRVYAALVFGVARQDEPLELRGITGLVGTLIFDRLKPLSIRAGWTPTPVDVAFRAQGSASAVADFMRGIALAVRELADVDQDQIDTAVAEIHRTKRHTDEIMSSMFTARYGLNGLGMDGIASLRASAMTPETVSAWSRQWLVADNAVVVTSSSLGEDFDIDLPAGREPRTLFARNGEPIVDRPSVVNVTEINLAASLVMPTEVAFTVWRPVLQELYTRLVNVDGVAIETRANLTQIGDERTILDFEVQQPTSPDALRSVVTAVRDIARDGVSAPSLSLALEKTSNEYDDHPLNVRARLLYVASAILRGAPPVDLERREALAMGVANDEIASAVSAALPSLIVGMDTRNKLFTRVAERAADVGLPFDRRDAQWAADPSTWRRRSQGHRVYRVNRHATVPWRQGVVTADALMLRSPAGLSVIPFDEIRIVGSELPELVTLVAHDGGSVYLGQRSWPLRFLTAIVEAAPQAIVEAW